MGEKAHFIVHYTVYFLVVNGEVTPENYALPTAFADELLRELINGENMVLA